MGSGNHLQGQILAWKDNILHFVDDDKILLTLFFLGELQLNAYLHVSPAFFYFMLRYLSADTQLILLPLQIRVENNIVPIVICPKSSVAFSKMVV